MSLSPEKIKMVMRSLDYLQGVCDGLGWARYHGHIPGSKDMKLVPDVAAEIFVQCDGDCSKMVQLLTKVEPVD